MVLSKKLGEKIEKLMSLKSRFKVVKFDPLPLIAENMKNGENLKTYFIKAYCRSCREVTIHSMSLVELVSGPVIWVRCTICGNFKFYAAVISKFIYKYCKKCGRNTVHALNFIYNDHQTYEERITCLGCGEHVGLGLVKRKSTGSNQGNPWAL